MSSLAPGPQARQTVVAGDPRDDPRWRHLARRPGASAFVSPAWITAICDAYGWTPEARIAIAPDGRVRGGFAWVRVRDLRGERLVSLPFSDRAEPFAADLPAWRALAADALAAGPPLTLRCLEGSPALSDPLATRVSQAAWHMTPLTGGADAVLGRLSAEARRNVRAAGRRGLRFVTATDLASVRAFHRLHVALRKRKYRMLAPPVALFEAIWRAFAPSDGVLVVLACDGSEPVAGALYLVWGDVLYYKFGASLASSLAARPNEGIAWTAMRWAIDRRLTGFDWGLSDLDQPGLLRFKRKWGGSERLISTARWGPPAPAAAPGVAEMLTGLTDLLTEDAVPDAIAARAGAILYRNFC